MMGNRGEDTGEMTTRLLMAARDAEDGAGVVAANGKIEAASTDDLAALLRAARDAFDSTREGDGGGAGGAGGGRTSGKPGKRNAGLAAAMALIGAVAAGGGSYAVLKATVADNGAAIEHHVAEPMHSGDAEYMQQVQSQIGNIDQRLGAVEYGQQQIVDGIEELKRENIDRLKKDLERAESELRRRRRDE